MSNSHPILGELIDSDNQPQKDAVHVAILPVKVNERLDPGQLVGLIDLHQMLVSAKARPVIGIVDPFLQDEVRRGERFWVLMLPGTTINLRHEWSHPSLIFTPSDKTLPSVDDECTTMGCQ